MLINLRRKIAIIWCSALISTAVMAQSPLVKMADHYFDNMSYTQAIGAYEQILKKKGITDFEKNSVKVKLAESYLKVKDNLNAERVLKDVVESTSDFTTDNSAILLKYAQALASNSKYQESQEIYQRYNAVADADPRGVGFSKLYNDISSLTKNAACYKIDYLSINTNAADFSPTHFQNGLIFVSNRKSGTGIRRVFSWNDTPFLDLYYLDDVSALSASEAGLGSGSSSTTIKSKNRGYLGNDYYTAASANDSKTIGMYSGSNISLGGGYADKPLTESERMNGTINSKYHEGPATFFKDGSKVIFTRNNTSSSGSTKKSSDGLVKLKLYMADAKKDSWGNIVQLPFNSDEYSTGHPALSPDEKLLFFASDMPGGYGGTDIYVSKYDGTNWSAPENLGAKVNTKGNEMFPYVDEKGNLYFSSEGHPGLGQLDIFYTQLVDGFTQKGAITNLGSPINSSSDDFGIITDGLRKSGFFSSNRKRGGNDDDIYKFERECEVTEGCDLLIAVYDADTKMPLSNSTVMFTNKDGKPEQFMTNESGFVQVTNVAEKFDYEFNATHDGYINNKVSYTTDECDSETSRLEVPMSKRVEEDSSEVVTKIPENELVDNPNLVNAKNCIIKGKAYLQATNQVLSGVVINLKNNCTGKVTSAITKADGSFSFIGTEGCDFTLEGVKEGLASKVSTVRKLNCKLNPKGIETNVYMFAKGDVVQIENIYFDYTKYNLRPDAIIEMDKLVKLMRQYPKMTIELGSHTDSRATSEFNQKLSENRAKATADYLFKRGISRSRVSYKGYGETQLVNKCADGVNCSEEEHQQNRRSEFRIIQMN